MFLDDDLGGNSYKGSASTDAIAVRADRAKLGFLNSKCRRECVGTIPQSDLNRPCS